jgi:hypothetical protein
VGAATAGTAAVVEAVVGATVVSEDEAADEEEVVSSTTIEVVTVESEGKDSVEVEHAVELITTAITQLNNVTLECLICL